MAIALTLLRRRRFPADRDARPGEQRNGGAGRALLLSLPDGPTSAVSAPVNRASKQGETRTRHIAGSSEPP